MEITGYSYGTRSYPIPAEAAAKELQRIAQKYNLDHAPSALIVEESRSASSVLHNIFTWDNTRAASKWRLQEAMQLAASIEVTFTHLDNPPQVVRAYYSSGHTTKTKQFGTGYRDLEVVVNTPAFAEEVRDNILHRLKTLRDTYGALEPFFPVWQAVDDLELEIARERKAAKKRKLPKAA